ncbi:thiol reductant ABC exporter subunit CydC [Glutamicibacter sp.]|uniref:thiol reductant ABC exporter subunit CydC n=1 Tax=Glutamicibacter sp. TaxID=1931995 RepID=UPI0028BDA87D|nr:thiol reductant ABC exporter subunit CydC [Glutamicibacter sp.]
MRTPRFLPKDLIAPRQLAVLSAFCLLKALGLVMIALGLGQWIAAMANGAEPGTTLLLVASAGAVARVLGVWGLNTASLRMGSGAKEKMRAQLVRTVAQRPGILPAEQAENSIPVTATLASHGIEKLDDYFTKFIPALLGAVIVPLLLGVFIFSLDWVSAVVLVLTIPLVPLFMALIGLHTQDTLRASQSSLDALAHQLYELAQGLPALLGLGRARRHGNAIGAVGEKYRTATMANLKTVFLSSFWLELISTLSVAVLAVMIGVRLVGGNMELAAGLSILILAPELFGALREVGSAYHAADDGLAAYQRYEKIIAPVPAAPLRSTTARKEQNLLEIRDLSLHYQQGAAIYDGFNLSLAPGEHRVLDGASGSGKSTLLRLIADTCTSDNGFDPQKVSGQIFVAGTVAMISQHPQFNAATGSAQLAEDIPDADPQLVARLAAALELDAMLEQEIGEYSPGELRRLEVLRAIVRLHTDERCTLLLADEPTAHLDEANAHKVRLLIEQLPERCAALIASHDPSMKVAAQENAAASVDGQRFEPMRQPAAVEPSAGVPTAAPRGTAATSHFSPWRELLTGYRPAKLAILYGSLSVMCAVGLAALSGWLIVQASYQPAILTLTVAFVMVRTLGIGRAALRYLEQLAIHDAVLGYAAALREKIWNSMVANPVGWGLISRSSVVLRFLLAEVDELRDLMARVVFPPIQAVVVWVCSVLVLWIIQPEFGIIAAVSALLLAFPGRWVIARVEGLHQVQALRHRLRMNQQVLGILRNKSSLRAFDSLDARLDALAQEEAQNTESARRHALGRALAPSFGALATTAAAIVMVTASQVSASMTALAVLLMLALADCTVGALNAVMLSSALKELTNSLSARSLAPIGHDETSQSPVDDEPQTVYGFELVGLGLGYGNGPAVVQGLDARIEPAAWTAVTGPSGSGKSTVLTALLGALEVREGKLYPLDAKGERMQGAINPDSVAWCPQEAHLFDSTLKRNLLLGAGPEQQVTEQQLQEVLERVGLGQWYALQPQGLATRIGSGGHSLSGGQRCKLAVARALIGGHQVILLDEPTAHLGQDEALELLSSLRRALTGRTVVLITHDARLAHSCEHQLILAAKTLQRA